MNTEAVPCASRYMEGSAKMRNAVSHQVITQANKLRVPARQPERAGSHAGTGGGEQSYPAPPSCILRSLPLIDMSLNIPGGNRNHRKGQDHVEGIGRLENHEARLVMRPRFAVVYQRELNRETIDAVEPASP